MSGDGQCDASYAWLHRVTCQTMMVESRCLMLSRFGASVRHGVCRGLTDGVGAVGIGVVLLKDAADLGHCQRRTNLSEDGLIADEVLG